MTTSSASRIARTALLALLVPAACRAPLPAQEARWRQARDEGVRGMLAPDARASYGGLRFYPFD
jgi:UTP:GlnB (protein PII) uridylyltransferase